MKRYIARDKSGALHVFSEKPTLHYERWWGISSIYDCEINASLFPEVTFENSPVKVEFVIKK